MTTWPLDRYLDHEGYVTADRVRALIADACPEMAKALRAMVITVTEPDPDDLISEELEAWIQSQFDEVVDGHDFPPGLQLDGGGVLGFAVFLHGSDEWHDVAVDRPQPDCAWRGGTAGGDAESNESQNGHEQATPNDAGNTVRVVAHPRQAIAKSRRSPVRGCPSRTTTVCPRRVLLSPSRGVCRADNR